MGNATSGCFVDPAIPPIVRELVVPHADVITPNQFELGFLTGTSPDTMESTLASADAALAMGPSTVLVTSVLRPDRPEDTIEMLAVTGEGAWSVRTPRLPIKANGSGDLTAALFTAHLRTTGSPASALGLTASSVVGVLRATIDSGERELQVVAAQDAIAAPADEFAVTQVR
jgi:pyridoxine kinase